MDAALARQYHKKLSELFSDLQHTRTTADREPIVQRMQNMLGPLYMVHSGAAQHIEEALRKLKYPELPIVNAAYHTINHNLQIIYDTIAAHTEQHFVLHGEPRVFIKPVAGDELRSLVEKNRLFHEDHRPFVPVLEVPRGSEHMFLTIERETLLPALERLGFPNPQALVVFRTTAVPHVSVPLENIPSLRLAKLRTGVPVTVVQHRVF